METQIQESVFSKQCKSDEIIEVSDSPSPNSNDINNSFYDNFTDHSLESNNTELVFVSNGIQDEPIDLTFVRSNQENIQTKNVSGFSNPTKIIIQPKQETNHSNNDNSLLYGRGCKRKIEFQNVPSEEVIVSNWPQTTFSTNGPQTIIIPESQHSQKKPAYSYAIVQPPSQDIARQLTARQQEILKMAKSIFSKRTRTLYHWMYPTASKQQIKQVVSSTWDSMAAQEKNIYIAQVLGRFGYANANLMVNPQLGQIKELPPMPGIQEFNPKASELQNAISSITNETVNDELPCTSNIQGRKKSRVTKKRIAQNLSNACQEFDDDPELSQELAQFSIMLKNQF